MDYFDDETEQIDENSDLNTQKSSGRKSGSQSQNSVKPQDVSDVESNPLLRAYDVLQDYRDAGGLKGLAKSAIDNKKEEIKDNIKDKIDNKKQDVKNKINDKINDKLPDSVKQKRDALKSKKDAMNNKINKAKQNAEDLKNAPNELQRKINEKAFRKGVKTAVNSFAPGVGEAAEKLLDTKKGEEAIEAARQASTPITAVKEGTKKLVEIVVRSNIRKNALLFIPIGIVFLVFLMVILSITAKAGNIYDYFKGNVSGQVGIETQDKEYKEFFESVEKYGTANKAMVVAVLTAYKDNEEYNGNLSESVDSCTIDEIESGDCIEEISETGILSYSKSKIKKYIKRVNKAIQENGGDITEGDYDNPKKTGSKFFQWLYTDFVEDYYKEYATTHEAKVKIIREIYLFYNELTKGNDDYCNNSFVNLTCPQVTVTGKAAGSYSLEDYIAAVVANELGYAGYPEAIRAQAIAARTYLFSVTDNCKLSIENSTSAQTLNPDKVNDEIRKAVEETAGMVLTKDGNVFLSQYSTFSPKMSCSGSVCTGTFYKQPSKTESKITIDVSKIGFTQKSLLGGHTNGMSQYGALYLDKIENKNYKEILKTFYDEDTEISSTTTSNVNNSSGYCGATDGGLVQLEGYSARLSRPQRNNSFYYNQITNIGAYGWLEGECAWYASARAKEILSTLGSDVDWTYNGNGGTYCDAVNYDKNKFETSTNVYSPRPGAIISWKAGLYGHVAVVEKVEGNKVTISEAGLSFGPTHLYGCSSGSCVRRFVTKSMASRRSYCEANGSGCFNTSTVDVSVLQNYGGNFQCYIYLGSKK